jgi:hypothetical protein
MTATVEVVAYEDAHRALPGDTTLTAAAVARILDPREPQPTRREAELLALLLRGHLAVLVPEVHRLLEAVEQPDKRADRPVRRTLAEASHLLAAPPIYTARRTVSVVPLALCCRDLHDHYAAASSPSLMGEA